MARRVHGGDTHLHVLGLHGRAVCGHAPGRFVLQEGFTHLPSCDESRDADSSAHEIGVSRTPCNRYGPMKQNGDEPLA